jgi:hypothetical protein
LLILSRVRFQADKVFTDKASGKEDMHRLLQLEALLGFVREDDMVGAQQGPLGAAIR